MDGWEDERAILGRAARFWQLRDGQMNLLRRGANTTVHLPGAGCVLRLHRAEVTVGRVEALHRARSVLRDGGVPTVPLLAGVDGSTWMSIDDRVVEAEAFLPHDGRMNSPDVLRRGAPVMAAVHNAWHDLWLPAEAEACDWANWIAPSQVVEGVRTGVERFVGVSELHPVCEDAIRLGHLVDREPADLQRQLVHGDFWDDNVYVRRGELVAVSDFDFVGRRPRIDDLALLLHFADEQPTFEGVPHRSVDQRISALQPLVSAYCRSLRRPLTDSEQRALPLALARQPLWAFGVWLPRMDDDDRARAEAHSLAGPILRALEVAGDADRWREGLFAATQAEPDARFSGS